MRATHNTDLGAAGAAPGHPPPSSGPSSLQIPSRGEGCLARWASLDCDLPERVCGKTSNFDQRVWRP
eukprot:13699271-Alexandrium_andersonii.AAC.1